ncbi:hypothetical protein KVT40_003518 [Elsinoe batatas]|uniref:Uncharacterized protein n=1 Tax=Elsinoe batatas TaxID=2601811 RepID=A0A8K0PJM0_9PEZI|nr:hypothetical protein KVT40_003518 [Elsinoe batatas]
METAHPCIEEDETSRPNTPSLSDSSTLGDDSVEDVASPVSVTSEVPTTLESRLIDLISTYRSTPALKRHLLNILKSTIRAYRDFSPAMSTLPTCAGIPFGMTAKDIAAVDTLSHLTMACPGFKSQETVEYLNLRVKEIAQEVMHEGECDKAAVNTLFEALSAVAEWIVVSWKDPRRERPGPTSEIEREVLRAVCEGRRWMVEANNPINKPDSKTDGQGGVLVNAAKPDDIGKLVLSGKPLSAKKFILRRSRALREDMPAKWRIPRKLLPSRFRNTNVGMPRGYTGCIEYVKLAESMRRQLVIESKTAEEEDE